MDGFRPKFRVWQLLTLVLGSVHVPIFANAAPYVSRQDLTSTVTIEDCDDATMIKNKNGLQTRATINGQGQPSESRSGTEAIAETLDVAAHWNAHSFEHPPMTHPGPFGDVTWGSPLDTARTQSSASGSSVPSTIVPTTTSQDLSINLSATSLSSVLADTQTLSVTVNSALEAPLSSSSISVVGSSSLLVVSTTLSVSEVSSSSQISSSISAVSTVDSSAQTSSSSTESSALPSPLNTASSANPRSSSLSSILISSSTSTASTVVPVVSSRISSHDTADGLITTLRTSTTSTTQTAPSTASVAPGEISSITSPIARSTTSSLHLTSQTTITAATVSTTTTAAAVAVVPSSVQEKSSISSTAASPTETATTSTQSRATESSQTSSQPTSSISLTSRSQIDTSSRASLPSTAASALQSISAADIFQPIATDSPPAQITTRSDHPVPRLGIQQQSQKLETNKFYANFFLGDQSAPTWTHPYSVAWGHGAGETESWGLAISHIERTQLAGGGSKALWDAGEWGYLVNPTGLQSIVLSAAELSNGTTLTTDSLEAFSVNVNLVPEGADTPIMTFPLVQGMGFVTAVYNDGTPVIQSGLGISDFSYVGTVAGGNTYKYSVRLVDNFTWLIYITPRDSSFNADAVTSNAGTIKGPSGFSGSIQAAKIPGGSTSAASVYDTAAGGYPTAAVISGSVIGRSGTYTISWTKNGNTDRPLLMFALPHHVESLSSKTDAAITGVELQTTTKGLATAISADSWTLTEPDLPIDMGFAPWTPKNGDIRAVSAAAREAISSVGNAELQQNITQQTNTGSLYYDGKALAKFATICVTLYEIAGNEALALTGLEILKKAFATHVNNKMAHPLVYDNAWGGAVSQATYDDGKLGDDFGNTIYNDHHFHFGYFVYAGAVIGYLDSDWLDEGTNKAWVNMLVRDYANSIPDDAYYPFSRMFDWYHGHSWAHGLIETGDGKDQESSSEDTMSLFAIKMWGQTIGDKDMEARGNLMLSIQARSLQHYYLYLNDNDVEPAEFIGNRAAGVLFENKIDHTTYFGNEVEYIEGIHMLPLMPCSTLTRTSDFVQQEWDTYFSSSGLRPASNVTGGWKGIIMANYAIIDPQTSYDYFADISQDELDGGASQTWYLAWSAALGGSPAASKTRRGATADAKKNVTISTATEAAPVSNKVSPRHHGDAYKLRSDGVGVPGVEVDLPSDGMSKESHHRMSKKNHGDAYEGHGHLSNTTTTTTTTAMRQTGYKRSSRLRRRTSGAVEQA